MAILGGASGCTAGEPGGAAPLEVDEGIGDLPASSGEIGGGAGPGGGFHALVECEGPDWQCGSNSPEIDNFNFHELNLDGQPNLQNIAMETYGNGAKLTKNGESYTMEVFESRIRGSNATASISGGDLVGAHFEVIKNGVNYKVHIDTVRNISYPLGLPGTLEAYRFSWSSPVLPPNPKRQLCAPAKMLPNPAFPPSLTTRPPEGPTELLGLDPDEVVVFETDRIDAVTKTMDPVGDPRWFNLACAGHTLAKLHMTRNTISSGADAHGVDERGRQATLKMLVADYCGTGKAFTVAGEPLRWKGGAMTSFYSPPTSLEARWTHEGAACLNVPRMLHTSASPSDVPWTNINDAIAQECTLPACTDLNVHNFDGAYRVSGNP